MGRSIRIYGAVIRRMTRSSRSRHTSAPSPSPSPRRPMRRCASSSRRTIGPTIRVSGKAFSGTLERPCSGLPGHWGCRRQRPHGRRLSLAFSIRIVRTNINTRGFESQVVWLTMKTEQNRGDPARCLHGGRQRTAALPADVSSTTMAIESSEVYGVATRDWAPVCGHHVKRWNQVLTAPGPIQRKSRGTSALSGRWSLDHGRPHQGESAWSSSWEVLRDAQKRRRRAPAAGAEEEPPRFLSLDSCAAPCVRRDLLRVPMPFVPV